MIQPEERVGGEWAEWYRLTPVQRWLESEKLWHVIVTFTVPNPRNSGDSRS